MREVLVDDEARQATVIVPDDQLSLAIGREGQNARLAAKLTGWRVDIVGESEFAEQADEEEGFENEEEVFDGRCSAVLSAGRRCPNAALPNSRYCGLPTHQALARFGTHQVTVLTPLSEDEVALLARADAPDDEVGPIVARAEEAFAEIEAEETAEEIVEAEETAEVTAEAEVEAEIEAEEEEAAEEAIVDSAAEETIDEVGEQAEDEQRIEEVAVTEAVAEDNAEEDLVEIVEAEEAAEEEVVEEAEELTEVAAEEEPVEGSEA